jgi:hypothetical protein
MTQFNLKEDIYSIGNTSKLVANEIHSLQKNITNSKNEQQITTSLIIIDRHLDLVSPSFNISDNIMDRIYSTLFNKDKNDNNIPNLKFEISKYEEKKSNCLSCITKNSFINLDHLVIKREKESLIYIRKCLMDIITIEKIPFTQKMGNVTTKELISLLNLLNKVE